MNKKRKKEKRRQKEETCFRVFVGDDSVGIVLRGGLLVINFHVLLLRYLKNE